jgi:hypothetical protein
MAATAAAKQVQHMQDSSRRAGDVRDSQCCCCCCCWSCLPPPALSSPWALHVCGPPPASCFCLGHEGPSDHAGHQTCDHQQHTRLQAQHTFEATKVQGGMGHIATVARNESGVACQEESQRPDNVMGGSEDQANTSCHTQQTTPDCLQEAANMTMVPGSCVFPIKQPAPSASLGRASTGNPLEQRTQQ